MFILGKCEGYNFQCIFYNEVEFTLPDFYKLYKLFCKLQFIISCLLCRVWLFNRDQLNPPRAEIEPFCNLHTSPTI